MNYEQLRAVIPQRVLTLGRKWRAARQQRLRASREPFSSEQFSSLLRDKLQVRSGDVLFVHSAIDGMTLGFPWPRLFSILREAVGAEGTLVFPTYPRLGSYQFLCSGEMFDVRQTPSLTGALSELARRSRGAVRSLHPTKSVCAIGPHAEYLCESHQQLPYPYGEHSPYRRLIELNGKAIGLGVSSARLSITHVVEDALKQEFPVRVYHQRVFRAPCIDRDGNQVIVATFAHDMTQMLHDVPRFVRRHLPPAIVEDLDINHTRFFRADAKPLFRQMLGLARRGISMYPRHVYSKGA